MFVSISGKTSPHRVLCVTQDDPEFDASEVGEEEKPKQEADDIPQAAEHAGKTSHDTQEVQQVQEAKDSAGKSENEQEEVKIIEFLMSLTLEIR